MGHHKSWLSRSKLQYCEKAGEEQSVLMHDYLMTMMLINASHNASTVMKCLIKLKQLILFTVARIR